MVHRVCVYWRLLLTCHISYHGTGIAPVACISTESLSSGISVTSLYSSSRVISTSSLNIMLSSVNSEAQDKTAISSQSESVLLRQSTTTSISSMSPTSISSTSNFAASSTGSLLSSITPESHVSDTTLQTSSMSNTELEVSATHQSVVSETTDPTSSEDIKVSAAHESPSEEVSITNPSSVSETVILTSEGMIGATKPATNPSSTQTLTLPTSSSEDYQSTSTVWFAYTTSTEDFNSITYSTEEPQLDPEFSESLLLIVLTLTCGTGVIFVIITIIFRCSIHRQAHTLETLDKDTDEILQQNTITPLETQEGIENAGIVDMSLVESVPITVNHPPPPPPPPLIRESNDADYVSLEDVQDPYVRKPQHRKDSMDRWTYLGTGDIHLKTFKGSTRQKDRAQSWMSTGTEGRKGDCGAVNGPSLSESIEALI